MDGLFFHKISREADVSVLFQGLPNLKTLNQLPTCFLVLLLKTARWLQQLPLSHPCIRNSKQKGFSYYIFIMGEKNPSQNPRAGMHLCFMSLGKNVSTLWVNGSDCKERAAIPFTVLHCCVSALPFPSRAQTVTTGLKVPTGFGSWFPHFYSWHQRYSRHYTGDSFPSLPHPVLAHISRSSFFLRELAVSPLHLALI